MYALILATAMSMAGQPDDLPSPVYGQNCPDGFCPIPSKVLQLPTSKIMQTATAGDTPRYTWEKGTTEDQFILRQDGKIVGQYWVPDGSYYPWDGRQNLRASKPPIDPPSGRANFADAKAMAEWQVSGVQANKLLDEEVVTFGGKVIGKHKMSDAFAGKLTDDSSKGYLLIVAKDEVKRNKVFQDYLKLPEDFRARYHLWMADPQHFTMQDRYNGKPRFVTEGDPAVILQNHKGEVLFRCPREGHVYQQGDMQELLKSDPAYNPTLDPGVPAKTLTDYLPKLSAQQWGYLGFGALAFVAYRRKQS